MHTIISVILLLQLIDDDMLYAIMMMMIKSRRNSELRMTSSMCIERTFKQASRRYANHVFLHAFYV